MAGCRRHEHRRYFIAFTSRYDGFGVFKHLAVWYGRYINPLCGGSQYGVYSRRIPRQQGGRC